MRRQLENLINLSTEEAELWLGRSLKAEREAGELLDRREYDGCETKVAEALDAYAIHSMLRHNISQMRRQLEGNDLLAVGETAP